MFLTSTARMSKATLGSLSGTRLRCAQSASAAVGFVSFVSWPLRALLCDSTTITMSGENLDPAQVPMKRIGRVISGEGSGHERLMGENF